MKKNSIVRSTIEISLITLGIKLLGLVKQSVIAACCGASDETDAFFVATGILVQLCLVVFSAISISLLSIHTDILVNNGRDESNKLINGVLRVFIPISIIISIIFYLFSRNIAELFAPSYNDKQIVILANYIQIMSWSFTIWCYYLILNVVLETDKRFLPSKGQAFFQNVFLICGAVFLYDRFGMQALVYSFLMSGIAQCALVSWCARKEFWILFARVNVRDHVKRLLALSFPLIVGNAIYEINDIVDKQLSIGLGSGSVSYLTYGGTINEIVTGVIVSSVTVILYSHFATWVAMGDIKSVERNLKRVLEYLSIIVLPIMVMCIGAGDQIVDILYGRGSFTGDDVNQTYGVVVGYALGFVFQAARANIVRVYYAFQDTRTPMINGAISVSMNVVLSIILSKYYGASGIALATSIAMLVVTILLTSGIKKHLPNFSVRDCCSEGLKGGIAALVCGFVLAFIRGVTHVNLYFDFLIEGSCVVIVYSIALVLLRSTSILDALGRIRKIQEK